MKSSIELAFASLQPADELAAFIAGVDGAGAVASFVGLTRSEDVYGRAVNGLFLDHYPGMTEASLADIGLAAHHRFALLATRIVHRCGTLEPNDPIVFVAAAATHRREAFLAADYIMDRLKTDAMFWKREDGPLHSKWIADYADRERWT